MLIFKIIKFPKYYYFKNYQISKIFGFGKLSNFQICLIFLNYQISGVFQNFRNCTIVNSTVWEIMKYPKFYKFSKLSNFQNISFWNILKESMNKNQWKSIKDQYEMKNQNETKDENLSKILINFTKIHKNFFF